MREKGLFRRKLLFHNVRKADMEKLLLILTHKYHQILIMDSYHCLHETLLASILKLSNDVCELCSSCVARLWLKNRFKKNWLFI